MDTVPQQLNQAGVVLNEVDNIFAALTYNENLLVELAGKLDLVLLPNNAAIDKAGETPTPVRNKLADLLADLHGRIVGQNQRLIDLTGRVSL